MCVSRGQQKKTAWVGVFMDVCESGRICVCRMSWKFVSIEKPFLIHSMTRNYVFFCSLLNFFSNVTLFIAFFLKSSPLCCVFFSIVVISSKQNYTNTNVRNEKCWYFANYGPVFVVFSRDDYICFVLFATQTMTESILPWN